MARLIRNITELEALVGQEVGVSGWVDITQERVNSFGASTNDEQWIHTDPVRAAQESPFGRTVAHGFLTLEPDSDVLYQIAPAYQPGREAGVRWDDPAFAVAWPARPEVISTRDAAYPDYRGG